MLKQYLVVGLGKTGQSVARYLKRKNILFDWFDTRAFKEEQRAILAEFPEVSIYFEGFPKERLAQIKAIIMSPGVSEEETLFEEAKQHNIPILGDIEWFASQVTAPVIGITGTNGKSTVTTLVGELLKAAGERVCVAGNIGAPVLDFLEDGQVYDSWVLELSSFQLALTEHLQVSASTILNISPDHLDRHHCLDDYVAAKQRIYKNSEICFYNRLDTKTQPVSDIKRKDSIFSYGLDEPKHDLDWGLVNHPSFGWSIMRGSSLVCPVSELKIAGQHNVLNAMAACALASTRSISFDVMRQVLSEFKGLAHRCEWVRTLEGVQWIDDSKGTNIGATISAIEGIGKTFSGQIVLIAGGQGKGADFSLLQPIVKQYVSTLILIGQDAPLLKEALHACVPVRDAQSLKEAVAQARQSAKSGDIVLLSPACASLDMFRDFNDRGDQFKAIVRDL